MPPALVPLVLGTDKPGFDLLLVGHVACALFGFGALATSGIQAARLRSGGAGAVGPTLRRYFAPGVNWAGRSVYGVPLFGFALLADSGGHLRIQAGWVIAGLALWTLAVLLAEGLLWPAERRIQSALADHPSGDGDGPAPGSIGRDCAVVGLVAAVLTVFFLVATVLMVARPG